MTKIKMSEQDIKALCDKYKVATSSSHFSNQKALDLIMSCEIIFTRNIVAYNFIKLQDPNKDVRFCECGMSVLDSMNNRAVGYSDLYNVSFINGEYVSDITFTADHSMEGVTEIYEPYFSDES
jgi:hypothetical protein